MPILEGVWSRTRTHIYRRVCGRARPVSVRARVLWWGSESYEGRGGEIFGNPTSVLLNRRDELRPKDCVKRMGTARHICLLPDAGGGSEAGGQASVRVDAKDGQCVALSDHLWHPLAPMAQ